jgi:hypothetical protein
MPAISIAPTRTNLTVRRPEIRGRNMKSSTELEVLTSSLSVLRMSRSAQKEVWAFGEAYVRCGGRITLGSDRVEWARWQPARL